MEKNKISKILDRLSESMEVIGLMKELRRTFSVVALAKTGSLWKIFFLRKGNSSGEIGSEPVSAGDKEVGNLHKAKHLISADAKLKSPEKFYVLPEDLDKIGMIAGHWKFN